MDDPVKAATRERWRDFVLSAGFKKIGVEVPGIDTLITKGVLEGDIVVDNVPLNSIMASRVFEIAIEKAVISAPARGTRKPGIKAVKEQLRANGISTGSARLSELAVARLRQVPQVRRAVWRLLDRVYRERGRDFPFGRASTTPSTSRCQTAQSSPSSSCGTSRTASRMVAV
eukprot:7385657-Prymnesium_polylepis.2